MTTLYVDNIAPNLQSKISAPNLTLPSGSILQVVSATATSALTNNTSSYTDLPGMSLNITPSSTSSKILIQYSLHTFAGGGSGNSNWGTCATRVLRGSTSVYSDSDALDNGGGYGSGANMSNGADRIMDRDAHVFIDTPNSTSQLTYKVQGAELHDRGDQAYFNYYGAPGRIIAMEIAG